jgi:hypothetical protein
MIIDSLLEISMNEWNAILKPAIYKPILVGEPNQTN